jgi:UDPglucose--hexose-1-phosphate uridylyltransferase
MVREEVASHQRIVLENDRFVVIAPFASRFPFESWIIPKEHRADFGTSSPADLAACGAALRETLRRMRQVLDDPPYNFVIHTSPIQLRDKDEEVYHWHIEVMPRLTRVAGFEWGSGFYINPTPPEEAAEFMRGASV